MVFPTTVVLTRGRRVGCGRCVEAQQQEECRVMWWQEADNDMILHAPSTQVNYNFTPHIKHGIS